MRPQQQEKRKVKNEQYKILRYKKRIYYMSETFKNQVKTQ